MRSASRLDLLVCCLLACACSTKPLHEAEAKQAVEAQCSERCGCIRVCFTHTDPVDKKPVATCTESFTSCNVAKKEALAARSADMTEVSECTRVSTERTLDLENAIKKANSAADQACACHAESCGGAAKAALDEAAADILCAKGTAEDPDTAKIFARGADCYEEVAPRNPVVVEVESLAERACACLDAACAQKVHADFMKFFADNADTKGSERDKGQLNSAVEKMRGCVTAKTPGAAGP